MIAYIVLGLMLSLPLFLGLVFRVSTSHLFLALLSGELLERFFGADVAQALREFTNNDHVQEYVPLAIVVIPMVLTAIFMRNTLSRGKTLLHVLPLAISGVIFAAFAAKLLPQALHYQLAGNPYGRLLLDSADFIIGIMIFCQLVSMWLFGRSAEKHTNKKY